jgi:hypothetical protein
MNSRTLLLVGASFFILCSLVLSQMHGGVGIANGADTIRDVDFNSPLDNNTYDLGQPFLIEYDNTTSVASPRNPNYVFEAGFSGYGVINGTRYTDTGVSSIDYRDNGTIVYQNGTIDMTTETGEKATMIFESVGQRDITTGIVYDHGFIMFTTNSTAGQLAALNNTVAVYKDKIDERRGNLTTIAWEWK